MRRSLHSRNILGVLVGYAALCCTPVFGQIINLVDGPVDVVVRFNLPVDKVSGQFRDQSSSAVSALSTEPGSDTSDSSNGLQFYTANYTALAGKQLPFNIVGTDPSLGANTTTVPAVLVPMRFIFPNPGNPTLDGTNVRSATQNSPIFLNADYTAGPVDLGVTQYGDALQRAEFWNLPGFSHNYHVLLGGPTIAPTVTVTVPTGKGNAYALSGGGFMGVVDTQYFEQILATLTPNYTADQLPIFLTDDVYLAANGLLENCCIAGFHASQGGAIATAKTWIYAAYGNREP